MLKEAIEKILSLANIQTTNIGAQVYSNQDLSLVDESTAAALEVRNLTGIVDYLRNDFDTKLPVIIHVESPTKVSVLTGFNRDLRRSTLIRAVALLPEIRYGSYYDIESFNVLLQSCFVQEPARDHLLKIVGNIKEEQVNNVGDDGTSQQVTAKVSVATLEAVPLPNPVALKPFRTFSEIEQPYSSFVFRMKTGPAAALHEADGGAWRLFAIDSIKAYFNETLEERIDAGEVVIIG